MSNIEILIFYKNARFLSPVNENKCRNFYITFCKPMILSCFDLTSSQMKIPSTHVIMYNLNF